MFSNNSDSESLNKRQDFFINEDYNIFSPFDGFQPNLIGEDNNQNEYINIFERPPYENNSSCLKSRDINKKSKKKLSIKRNPLFKVIKVEEGSEEQKHAEIQQKNKNKKIPNMDDSLSTIYQTRNKIEKKYVSKEGSNLNKKRKRNDSENPHNKYSYDNILKKIKFIVLKNVRIFINDKIKELYNNNIGKGIDKKKLFTINKKQNSNVLIDYNKKFMNKKLLNIFSEDITTKATDYSRNKNETVIKGLMAEADEKKKSYFSKLFNLSFIDCLHHFINKEFVKELDGLLLFDEMINDSKKLKEMRLINCEDEYLFQLKSHLENFEIELNGKSGRNRRASIDKIN